MEWRSEARSRPVTVSVAPSSLSSTWQEAGGGGESTKTGWDEERVAGPGQFAKELEGRQWWWR